MDPLGFWLMNWRSFSQSPGPATAAIFAPRWPRRSILRWCNCRSCYPSARLGLRPPCSRPRFRPWTGARRQRDPVLVLAPHLETWTCRTLLGTWDMWDTRSRAISSPAAFVRALEMVLREHNSRNLLMWWAAPEFSRRRRGHSPLLMILGRGGTTTVVGVAQSPPVPPPTWDRGSAL
jgi:hypothetical protein